MHHERGQTHIFVFASCFFRVVAMAYCPAGSSLGQAGLRSAELSARGVEDSRGVSSGLADGYAWAAPPPPTALRSPGARLEPRLGSVGAIRLGA